MTEKPPARPQPPGLSVSLEDIYHILFRHKWKIAMISGAGIVCSLLLPRIQPAPYMSEAKLYIRYVLESRSPTPVEANDPRIKSPDTRGDSIMNTELEILTSGDLAQQVADTIGPEKILGANGGTNRLKAGAVVRKGLTAEVPKNSSVIRLVFQHADSEIVQPVLSQLIEFYLKKHVEIHAVGAFDDFLTQETDQLRSSLARTEQELEKAKTNLGYYSSLEEARQFQGEQISKIRQSIFDAEAELAERKAAANELAGITHAKPAATTNTVAAPRPEKLAEYKKVSSLLESLRKKEQEYLQIFTPESSVVKPVAQQISENMKLKRQLEEENPELLGLTASQSTTPETGISARIDLASERVRVSALDSKISVLNGQLAGLRKEAAAVGDAEGIITKLQLQKEVDQGRYKHFVQSLEQARIDEKIGNGKESNISTIQKPSPPLRDTTKLQKMRIGLAVGGVAFAVGLAFLLELFLDRSVKRPGEVEAKAGLPLFLTIPLIQGHGSVGRLGWFRKVPLLTDREHARSSDHRSSEELSAMEDQPRTEPAQSNGFMADWNPSRALLPFFEALRDRLIGFFELKNLTHKPKLVAVTSCGEGSGVTTIAAGLAASLSQTGDGNVLLVDMNQRNGATHHFLNGHLDCCLDDALEIEKRGGALVHDNLYVVSESNGNGFQLPRILPKRFTNLVPKLKASDYDYIIFDMPSISQLSVTPRIAKFMDVVLLVVESEKTDREVLKRAITFLNESKPNLCAVLNKHRTYVPKVLQQEL